MEDRPCLALVPYLESRRETGLIVNAGASGSDKVGSYETSLQLDGNPRRRSACRGRRVVVTGLGVATALGLEVKANWERLLGGVSGTDRLSLERWSGSPVRAAAEVGRADWQTICAAFPEDAATGRERRTLFALWAGRAALEDAGLPSADGNRCRYGVSSSAGAGITRLEDVWSWTGRDGRFDVRRFGREYTRLHPESLIRNSADRCASRLAKTFGLLGPNATITSACAAGTQALGLAFRSIRRGAADVMLAGGADSMINPVGIVFFDLLTAAATGVEDPRKACRPFDLRRRGLVVGEGAGYAVLEDLEHAVRRGGRIYAEVAGYGSSVDGFRVTAPDPEGRGAARAMRSALGNAGLAPEDVDYVNAHGTGTRQNDLAETRAIKLAFGKHAASLAISSSKSMIGHLMAAAGGPEFVYTVLSVYHDEIHPTANLESPDPGCDLDYVTSGPRPQIVRAAISNSFGFGGQNAAIAVKKFVL